MNAPAITLDPSQERAVRLMVSAPFGIVTGGPGCGKTTTLRYALDHLDTTGKRYLLAAPTGKAARRIFESTERQASTIHRLLEFGQGVDSAFGRDAMNPLETDVVFIDESSMIDVELGAALVQAIDPKKTRLILIGDADQLPPVGPGRMFGDLVEAGEKTGSPPVARLTTLHRSALESWIHVNAQRVLRGEMLDLAQRKDFRFIDVGDDATKILPAVAKLITETIPKEIDAKAQVLIPQNPGVAGIAACNLLLQKTLNPKKQGLPFIPRTKGAELRIGDKVIQTKNDYALAGRQGVFNGELGQITDIHKGGVMVDIVDRGEVAYSLEQSNALQLAYALTVHRFQGSEIPWAVCVVHSTHSYILDRRLVYTAITRGKQGVILVGNRKGLQVALSDKKPTPRNTGLLERMRREPDMQEPVEAKAS